jgi:hypothetical protein
LAGDFRVSGGSPLDVARSPETDLMLNSTWVLKDDFGSDGPPIDAQTPDSNAARVTGKSERPTAPVHIVQIINNGLCSKSCNDTDKGRQFRRNDGVNSQRSRNEGNRVSRAGLSQKTSNNRQVNRKILQNAYNHFDSEILDRFLQVFAPPHNI